MNLIGNVMHFSYEEEAQTPESPQNARQKGSFTLSEDLSYVCEFFV